MIIIVIFYRENKQYSIESCAVNAPMTKEIPGDADRSHSLCFWPLLVLRKSFISAVHLPAIYLQMTTFVLNFMLFIYQNQCSGK